jgi:tol-pal system protein YbgF
MKYFLPIIFFIFASIYFYSLRAEETLTIKQQLDRIVQEVSDLNKAVFNKSFDRNDLNLNNNPDDTERFTSIDIRMYDLERDIKNLTLQFEEIIFKLDDFSNYIQKLENDMNLNLEEIKNKSEIHNIESSKKEESITLEAEEENTLGKLVISEDTKEISNNEEKTSEEKIINKDKELNNLSPEEQLQFALDQMMKKNYDKSKISLEEFIQNFPENQLSGSAHFWLGKIYLFESNYRKAAIVFGEGVQRFPQSIKVAEMYYELSKSLKEMNKFSEACKTLSILNRNYKGNKFAKDPDKIKDTLECEVEN